MNYNKLKKAELIEAIKIANNQLDATSKELKDCKVNINSLKQDKEHLAQIISSRDKDLLDCNNIISNLNNDIEHQTKTIHDLEKKHQEDIAAIDCFRNTNKDLFKKWQKANDELDGYKIELNASRETIKDKLYLIKKLKKQTYIYNCMLIVMTVIMLFMIMWC